ncbi:unnamed protein product, partial [Ixodes hexagonus]
VCEAIGRVCEAIRRRVILHFDGHFVLLQLFLDGCITAVVALKAEVENIPRHPQILILFPEDLNEIHILLRQVTAGAGRFRGRVVDDGTPARHLLFSGVRRRRGIARSLDGRQTGVLGQVREHPSPDATQQRRNAQLVKFGEDGVGVERVDVLGVHEHGRAEALRLRKG